MRVRGVLTEILDFFFSLSNVQCNIKLIFHFSKKNEWEFWSFDLNRVNLKSKISVKTPLFKDDFEKSRRKMLDIIV